MSKRGEGIRFFRKAARVPTGSGIRMGPGMGIGLALGMAALATPARADQAGDADRATLPESGEIVVTARRQAESLANVPITISVITAEDIRTAGIEGVADYARLVPNVTFDSALNLGQTHLTIRGISQVQGAQPPAAIVVDGVLLISPLQFNVDSLDLAQIEVLKGPQGAIYGRNAIAGAINITTRRPTGTLEGEASIGFGRGEEWTARARLSGPLVPDLLGFTASAGYTDRRGQIRNVTTGKHTDHYENLGGRLGLYFTPSPDVSIDLRYAYSDTKGGDPSYINNPTADVNDVSTPVSSDVVGRNPRTLHELSASAAVETGMGTAQLVLAYVSVDESLHSDFDFTGAPLLLVDQGYRHRGFSQELRFTSKRDAPFRWMVGAYHVRLRQTITTSAFADPGLFLDPPEPTGSPDFLFVDTLDRNRLDNVAAFAQAEYDLADGLELGVALRYDRDRIRLLATGDVARRARFSKWQPKVTLRYRPSTAVTAYASYGEGFRSGGFNPSQASIGNPVFLPESATTYEAGVRAQLFGRALSLNLSAFHTDLKNGQILVLDALSGSNVGLNVPKVRIRGLEAEAALSLGSSLKLDAALGIADSRIGAFPEVPAYRGNDMPRVADYTLNLGATHERDWGAGLSSALRVDYQRIGPFYWDVTGDARRRAVDYLNARLTLSHEKSGGWFALWGRNLLNDRATADYQTLATTGNPIGFDVFFPARGATYGVELGVRF